MNVQLTINPNFESVIPPMTTAELVLLEDNILADGKVLMPIVVWNGTIIDGHKRFKIVGKHPEIQFTITELFFEDEYEAIAWICKNQLGRRNLPEEYKKYLIGKRYAAEKKDPGIYIGKRLKKMISKWVKMTHLEIMELVLL